MSDVWKGYNDCGIHARITVIRCTNSGQTTSRHWWRNRQTTHKLMAQVSVSSAMGHHNSLACQRAFSVCSATYAFVRWPAFIEGNAPVEGNAPGDASRAAAQPRRGKFKQHLRFDEKCCWVVDEKWFYQLTQHEPDLALSANISKFNTQYPHPLTSSTALDWMQIKSIDEIKLFALNVGNRVRDKYVRSCPVECEQLETELFHWFQGQEAMDSFEAMLQYIIYLSSGLLTMCFALVQLGSCEAHHCFVNQC